MTLFSAAAAASFRRSFCWRTSSFARTRCCRWASTKPPSSSENRPLLIALDLPNENDDGGNETSVVWRPPLLMSQSAAASTETVSSVQQAMDAIHSHYASGNIIGMGENDLGVYLFAATSSHKDILDLADATCDLMSSVKQERHGVPFHLCTTGIASSSSGVAGVPDEHWELWMETHPASWIVSLYAASPDAYAKETTAAAAGSSASPSSSLAFGQVCTFIVEAAERGMAVEAAVVPSQAVEGREMALGLGAQQVHVME